MSGTGGVLEAHTAALILHAGALEANTKALGGSAGKPMTAAEKKKKAAADKKKAAADKKASGATGASEDDCKTALREHAKKHGRQSAENLVALFEVDRASNVPEDKRSEFIERAAGGKVEEKSDDDEGDGSLFE